MINPKELRLENIIEFNTYLYRIKGFDKYNIKCYLQNDKKKETLYEIKSHYFSAVPLTEEILLKCSLNGDEIDRWNRVVVNEYEYYDRYVFYNAIDGTSNLEVHVVVSNYGDEIHKQFILSIDKDERQGGEIDQLHKFQNGVYWVTDGKELEIKL